MSLTRIRPVHVIGALALSVAGLGIFRAGAVAAPAAWPPPATSVAVVDMEKLMGNSSEVKARNESLAKWVEPEQAKLQALADDLKKKKAALELLSKESPDYIPNLVEAKKVENNLEGSRKLAQDMVDLKKGDMLREVYKKAVSAVDSLAKREGWQIVLLDDRNLKIPQVATDRDVNSVILNKRILFADDSVDITARVIVVMNNAFNAGK